VSYKYVWLAGVDLYADFDAVVDRGVEVIFFEWKEGIC
jgi:hypothetical protein